MKPNLDIVSCIIQACEFLIQAYVCIMRYAKMTKSDNIRTWNICMLRSTCLSFLCILEYQVFESDFIHVCV
jgi:hypothetical protein